MSKPRILALDIETSYNVVETFDLMDAGRISPERIVVPSRVLMVGTQWLGEKRARVHDESRGHVAMLRAVRAEMNEADAILTYNGDSFDLPRLAGEFETHGIAAPRPAASIDLYKVVRGLRLASGKLGYAAPALGVGEKLTNEGAALWRAVAAKDPPAGRRMARYCRRDVELLGPLYLRLRPRIKNHPVLADAGCTACGSDRLQSRGIRRTKAARIERLQCADCGTWLDGSRTRTSAQHRNGKPARRVA